MSPTIAWRKMFLAVSSRFVFPAEVMYKNPAYTIIATAIIPTKLTAVRIKRAMMSWMDGPVANPAFCANSFRSTPCAKTGTATINPTLTSARRKPDRNERREDFMICYFTFPGNVPGSYKVLHATADGAPLQQ